MPLRGRVDRVSSWPQISRAEMAEAVGARMVIPAIEGAWPPVAPLSGGGPKNLQTMAFALGA